MTTLRTPYEAATPDRSTFPPLDEDLVDSPEPIDPSAAVSAAEDEDESVWRRSISNSRKIVRNNTGMLLVAASEVSRSNLIPYNTFHTVGLVIRRVFMPL